MLPSGRFERAQVLQWLFFEQYSHEPYVAVARFIAKFLPEDHPRRADLPRLREKSREALAVMERTLDHRVESRDASPRLMAASPARSPQRGQPSLQG